MTIDKISVINKKIVANPKITLKKTFPVSGNLSVLPGSSMGPIIPPHNVTHVPGTSVTDPLVDQLMHTGDMLLDAGAAIGEATLNGLTSLGDLALDAGCAIVDGASDMADAALEALDKIIGSIG